MLDRIATIIIVTHNSARWLPRQRAALDALSERPWKLIVVDNASPTEERPTLDQLPTGATLIQSERNLGFAAANNLAAGEADTPYLIFLNPDAFPEPIWLSELIALADRHRRAAAIGSTQIRADAPHIYDGAGDVLHASGLAYRSAYGRARRGSPPPLGETFSACAAAMLVRRTAFEEVGGFDESYFCFFEDVDLGFRLRLAGWSILQSPTAVVEHVGGGSAGSRNAFADFHGARNRTWTFFKCMPGALMWPLLPLHILAVTLAASVALFTGRGLAAWRGVVAGFAGLPKIWPARRQVQAARRVSALRIAAMLAWSPHTLLSRAPILRSVSGVSAASAT